MSASGSSIAYCYNADGKRIFKTVNGTTCNYSYLGDQLAEMTWSSNKLHFTYDSIGPASVTYNGRYFYLKNAQGDVTGLVNASGTHEILLSGDNVVNLKKLFSFCKSGNPANAGLPLRFGVQRKRRDFRHAVS